MSNDRARSEKSFLRTAVTAAFGKMTDEEWWEAAATFAKRQGKILDLATRPAPGGPRRSWGEYQGTEAYARLTGLR